MGIQRDERNNITDAVRTRGKYVYIETIERRLTDSVVFVKMYPGGLTIYKQFSHVFIKSMLAVHT